VFNPICVENSVFHEDHKVAVTGRVMSIREAGSKLIFIDLTGDDHKVQIMASAAGY
jgi:lysyl-tRNA synthetase class II